MLKANNHFLAWTLILFVNFSFIRSDLFGQENAARQAREGQQTAGVAGNGALRLLATDGEIHGERLAIYEPRRILGWWINEDDHVIWTANVPRAGEYQVWMEWSIPDKWAGNRFVLEASESQLEAQVPSTGSFDNFLWDTFGKIRLEAGAQRIKMRPEGSINGELADVREVRLIPVSPPDANRLTYLDESDPFYVELDFPKLVTPQWIGEEDVEAVVILGIDDLRGNHEQFETYLRPILNRLKQIDGRAPVSIFSNELLLDEPILRQWLSEGLSLESHTMTHPCPILAENDLERAIRTYHDNVDWLHRVPGNRPVAVRTPCMDSMNSTSPRLFSELFNDTSSAGQHLKASSTVMNIYSSRDSSIPRDWIIDSDGTEKFYKYLPSESFATTIENYSYPYVIGNQWWEFPTLMPSDWVAQNFHGKNNPVTAEDWKTAVDITVLKQGTLTLVFHPYDWIRNDQVVGWIDAIVRDHGRRVKFLTFPEALQRIQQNLLAGHALRASNGQDNGIRLLDLDNDGYLDVVIGNEKMRQTRIWKPEQQKWTITDFPVALVSVDAAGNRHTTGVRFGIFRPDGNASMLIRTEERSGAWHFDGEKWVEDLSLLEGLQIDGRPILTSRGGVDRGVRLRDTNNDGVSELIAGNESQTAVLRRDRTGDRWERLPYGLPEGTSIVDAQGRDNGLRFVDLNEDGYVDIIFSNEARYSVHLYAPEPSQGWSRIVQSGNREESAIPMIVREGPYRNNGAWFHARHMWVQNEDTAHMPHVVDRRSYDQILGRDHPNGTAPRQSDDGRQ